MDNMKSTKIIFFGTSAFAIPILQKLIDENYDIISVVTQPDKPVGRKQVLTPPPVKVLAQKNNLAVFQPVSLYAPIEIQFPNLKYKIPGQPRIFSGQCHSNNILNEDLIISECSMDSVAGKNLLIITASYGKIIPKHILDIPQYGALNIHPSLLPKYRGPSPIQYAILNGDNETGVTIMLMDEKMDNGPILSQEKISLLKGDILGCRLRYQVLHDKLSQLGAELLIKTIPKWISGEIKPIPQDVSGTRHCLVPEYTKILTKEDGKIDWKKSAIEIERQIRAFTPWPGCWTIWNIGGKEKRVKILDAVLIEGVMSISRVQTGGIKQFRPGQIITTANKKMTVVCGIGHLEILKLQQEGKKEMSGEEFLTGYRDAEKVI